MKKFLFVLLFFLAISSCSFFKPKIPPYPTGLLFPLEEDSRIIYPGEIINSIQKKEGKIFFSTEKGYIFCFDTAKKEILWRLEIAHPLSSPSSLGLENIYIFDRSSTIYCLDLDGNLAWEKKMEEKISSQIRESQKRIYLGTEEGGFFALSASSGEEIWRFRAGGPIKTSPVFFENKIIFGCDDGKFYFLDQMGRLVHKFEAGSAIQVDPLLEGDRLYFSSADNTFCCLDLTKRKKKWKVQTGGITFASPLVWKERIFFLGSNAVLYCLNKRSGEILWWRTIPSRSLYSLEIAGERILASSLSAVLVCFDIKTGEEVGRYWASQEIKSNPLWLSPYLLINLYDFEKEEGSLVFLKKEIKVLLSAAKLSPQVVGEEIGFQASAVGFYRPRYEFYLKIGDKREVVQKESEKSSWIWYPEKDGSFTVGVKVVDEKEMAEAEIPFEIVKDYP